jgi:hypothetical protein
MARKGKDMKLVIVKKGGKGSGHYGHAGRTGKVGGSAPGAGGGSAGPNTHENNYTTAQFKREYPLVYRAAEMYSAEGGWKIKKKLQFDNDEDQDIINVESFLEELEGKKLREVLPKDTDWDFYRDEYDLRKNSDALEAFLIGGDISQEIADEQNAEDFNMWLSDLYNGTLDFYDK